jgi:hypothetical protein
MKSAARIDRLLVNFVTLQIHAGQLSEKASEEIMVRRPEGLGEEHVTDYIVWMIWRDFRLIWPGQHLYSRRRFGSLSSKVPF